MSMNHSPSSGSRASCASITAQAQSLHEASYKTIALARPASLLGASPFVTILIHYRVYSGPKNELQLLLNCSSISMYSAVNAPSGMMTSLRSLKEEPLTRHLTIGPQRASLLLLICLFAVFTGCGQTPLA